MVQVQPRSQSARDCNIIHTGGIQRALLVGNGHQIIELLSEPLRRYTMVQIEGIGVLGRQHANPPVVGHHRDQTTECDLMQEDLVSFIAAACRLELTIPYETLKALEPSPKEPCLRLHGESM